ncbi:hypothetical protein [Nocardia arizonensis]|uniref:hypothetical protein n=1 Tax=Nocardia arizonensis TaxID=1141647 RepID=UPI0006D26E55|nr:hypothetical protein [Nocardia arizonensis]
MSYFVGICPCDDGNSTTAADWYKDLVSRLCGPHQERYCVDHMSPADQAGILQALRETNLNLVCYFGHGTSDDWLTSGNSTVNKTNVNAAAGKAVVSVACKTGRNLGAEAINQGVEAWLGFTIRVPIIPRHAHADPLGEAVADGLARLASQGTMQDARDKVEANMRQLIIDYDKGGTYYSHPNSTLGYFAALALANSISLVGKTKYVPLP